MVTLVEETLEMVGVVLAIAGVLSLFRIDRSPGGTTRVTLRAER